MDKCGWWQRGIVGVVMAIAVPAAGMTYRQMSDENLVAASALVVVADVEAVRSARLADGRIVTESDLRIDTVLAGQTAAAHIRVTEPGGRVGAVVVRIPGVPRFEPGERTLVFLRERPDGTLGTAALALGKYTIVPGVAARARRATPPDDRSLEQFAARVRSLGAGGDRRPVGDGFGGTAATQVDVRVDAFTLLGNGGDCNPTTTAGCVGGRWFEARCGEAIEYASSGHDATLGAAESRAALDAALAAWSSAPGGRLALVAGPEWPTVPSALAPTSFGDFDGTNVVQFDDPYDIVPDLVGCEGVLAVGGTVSTSSDQVVDGDTTYDRTLEGDVVVNPGVGACFGADGLAETLAHEVGHTLGFGHSSENPSEPDQGLSDALMYFRIHADGRGASLRADDLAGLAFVYGPPAAEPTPAAEALRDTECLLAPRLWSSACFLDQETAGRLPGAPFKKAAKAARMARKAHRATKAAKQSKLLGRADRLLAKAEVKVADLTSNGTFRTECATGLDASLERSRTSIAAAQAAVAAAP